MIETIVAFVILSLVLGATSVSVGYAMKMFRRAQDLRIAEQLAQRLIAEHFVRTAGPEKTERGTDGKLVWAIRRVDVSAAKDQPTKLISFRLDVSDKSGRALVQYQSYYISAPQ
ncbi:type IV pilus modification PilV family protein [Rhizobium alvei]|uniref:Type II secretion system protein n=1 Tax=Rhizobium alvei TaxID=1132659 RepID=A0ABT8YNQ1_9HYPH|nr:type II secretion system protein [Rhizobium alvei]MDO6965246.1 type II secretion system protein [Rhizobium alvei]